MTKKKGLPCESLFFLGIYMLYKSEELGFSGDDGDGRGERASCCWIPAACLDRSCNLRHVGLTR